MRQLFIATAVAATTLGSVPAFAALGGSAGVVIPYAGKLEQNGVLNSGAFDFQFEVLTDATTTTVCTTKLITAVAVTNGEFSLTIPAVPEACVAGKDVHLVVSVRSAGGGAFVLMGKQRMAPALGAMTSGTGDFNTGGRITAANATINGSVQVGSAVNAANGSFGTVTTTNALLNSGIFTINPTSGTFPWLIFAEADGRLVFSTFGVGARRVSFAGNESGTIRSGGSIVAASTPDIAETIGAASDVGVSDVVCADPAQPEHIVRCVAGDHGVVGVISDGTSAFMINARSNDIDGPLTGQPLVLAGRVPVKVSMENGPIHIGDELALSSTPGVAMRATGPGPVVGIALGEATSGSATVLCFVKVAEGNAAVLEKKLAALQARLEALEAANQQAAR